MALLHTSSLVGRLKAPCPLASRSLSRGARTWSRVRCVEWDPEGLLGKPQTGHIARFTLQKNFSNEAEQQEALRKQAQLELERRRSSREARVVPDTDSGLIDFFLETEAREIEYEIARCRLRLNDAFFSHLSTEIATLKFKISRTQEAEDRLVELEALHKVLTEGTEAYDKLAMDMVGAKQRLTKILTSKDKKATLLEMVAANEVDRSLLVLLDQNITTASQAGQKEVVGFMERIRAAVIKYISL